MVAVGGSDFHGYSEYDYLNIGRIFIDEEQIKSLKEKYKSLKK